MITETAYIGYDNTIDIKLLEDGETVDLSSVTRMTLTVAGATIDSLEDPDVFDWSAGDGVLVLALGDQELTAGTYRARLVVYDEKHDDGIVWEDFALVVTED
jgi:hypothetical protein